MKRRIATIVVMTVAALVGLDAATALAADFRFIVPVHVSNLPKRTTVFVYCRAHDDSRDVIIGEGFAALPGAEFEGTATVEFDAREGEFAEGASHFDCTLQLASGPGGRVMQPVMSWEGCEEIGLVPQDHKLECGQRGSNVVGELFGEL